MSEHSTKAACAMAGRKLAAAMRRIEDIPHLFGDVDFCLQSEAQRVIYRVRSEFETFDQSMRETVNEPR